jgi:hypothetical protein
MRKEMLIWCMIVCLTLGLFESQAQAGAESPIGKWVGKAETPNGLLDFQFEFKQQGSQLVGSGMLMQTTITLSAVKFEDPQLSLELSFGGENYRLISTVKEGKLSGTWQQIGGDLKGSFNAERQGPPAPVTTGGGIAGNWTSVAVAPNGEIVANLDLKLDGEILSGVISSDQGSLEIQKASFKDDKLQFDLDLGGNVYRIEAALKDDKFTGKWSRVGSEESGAWSATRKASAAAAGSAAVPKEPLLNGDWNSIATTPNGDLSLTLTLKQEGDTVTGTLGSSEGSVPLLKGIFNGGKLNFEVKLGDNLYRVDFTLADGKLRGSWKQVEGTESGNITAERKKP